MKKLIKTLFFIFVCLQTLPVSARTIKGYYSIYPLCSSNKVVTVKNSKDVGANIYLYKNKKKDTQIFYIEPAGDGCYYIKNKATDKYIDVASKKSKANIFQNYRKNSYQKWQIKEQNGYCTFINCATKKAMTVKGSKNKNGTNIYSYKYKGKKGQKFKLIEIQFPKTESTTKSTEENKKLEIEDVIIPFFVETQTMETSTRKWTDKDYTILINILGAVESGGQIYGNRDYTAYEDPYENTENEHTITIGWAQYYGYEAKKLIQKIYTKNKTLFKLLDSKNLIVKMLKKDWVAIEWCPSEEERKIIIALITSPTGKECQDEIFKEYMKTYVEKCQKEYTSNAWAIVMYCEIRHLGGENAAKRIFDACNGKYTLDNIMNVLKRDQKDSSSNYQVGDEIFWSRHEKCCEFLQTYAQ